MRANPVKGLDISFVIKGSSLYHGCYAGIQLYFPLSFPCALKIVKSEYVQFTKHIIPIGLLKMFRNRKSDNSSSVRENREKSNILRQRYFWKDNINSVFKTQFASFYLEKNITRRILNIVPLLNYKYERAFYPQ